MMSNKERFEGFKRELVERNERAYGAEIRAAYGDETVDATNTKLERMSEGQWRAAEELRREYENLLQLSAREGDPAGETAQRACDLHRQWLCCFWPEGSYTSEAHRGLAELYVADERFSAYYNKIVEGGAVFLRDAILIYCSER